MRRFFRWVLRILVLVVVFLISLLTAMRFAIHGREVPVPKLTGMTSVEAQHALEYHGLVLVRESRYYSPDVPEGKIISQVPSAGEKVRRGWRVRVAESLGPQREVIPALVGNSERAAELNIRRRGLDLGTVAFINLPDSDPDTVVAQDPPPNATGVISPKVSLLVAAPAQPKMYVMPDFTNQPLDAVVREINNAGFKIANIHTVPAVILFPSAKNVATVVHQSPAPGQRVTPDAIINVDVSR
ncbi:MAG TPA: PASTA domain-containing protein [Candidatus Koribacter sp.]|jgi:beta-lactam-binding protein with PASTA domain